MDKFIGLHAVIIKKPYDYKKAKQTARKILKKKIINEKETKNNYKFIDNEKNYFYNKSFITKKINSNLSIIVGILKPEYQELQGGGILDFFKKGYNLVKTGFNKGKEVVKNTLIRTDNYNNTTTKHLREYGDLPVQRLTIYRTPIMKILDKVINIISLGQFSKLKKEYGFDELYHLALVADVGNKTLVIEKNEVINVNTSYKTTEKTEKLDVDLKGKKFTINQMLEEGRKQQGDKKWFLYDPWTNNCQFFIKYCLEAVGLFGTKEKDFLYQDISELQTKLNPVSKAIAKGVTTTGAIFNKLTGRGEKKKIILRINKK
jgi:hypothetical protein